jgi:hypothetical protein
LTDHSAALDAVECLRGREREVEELPGGLTNVNPKVTTAPGSVVVRIAQTGSELLAIDRWAEHLNSQAAAEAGVGAPVLEYVEDPGLLVVGFIEGHTFTDEDLRSGDHLARVAVACRRLHEGPRFVNDFDMFEIQPRYLDIVHEHGFRLPDRYADFADQAQQIRRAMATKPKTTVPCNNDLLAGNRRRGQAVADRLRVRRQQRPLLRARQPLERGQPGPRTARGADGGVRR